MRKTFQNKALTYEERKQREQIYNSRIESIKNYFKISENAASYIFFRRKRGSPWKKQTDPKYLEWSPQLQNALILADSIFGFDWASLEYGNEETALASYGIEINKQSSVIGEINNKENGTDDGWITVSNKKNVAQEIKILQKIGLLPVSKNEKK